MRITSYHEKAVKFIPLPPWLSIIVFWELLYLADYLIEQSIPGSPAGPSLFGGPIIFFISIFINTIFCSKQLTKLAFHLPTFIDKPADDLEAWYSLQLRKCYEGWMPIAFGLLVGLVSGYTMDPIIRKLTADSTGLLIFRHGYHFVGYFFLGISLWALAKAATMPLALARFKVKVSSFQVRGTGLQTLGMAYFRMALSISVSFFIAVVFLILSPFSSSMVGMLWSVFGALSIFLFFIVPQMGIHKIMSEVKYKKLDAFSFHLDTALEQSIENPSPENMKRLKELFELQGHLKNINEWPFELSMVWQLVTALIIPLGMAAVEIFFKD